MLDWVHFDDVWKCAYKFYLFWKFNSGIRKDGRNIRVNRANEVKEYERVLTATEAYVHVLFAFMFYEFANYVESVFGFPAVRFFLKPAEFFGWLAL